MTCTVLSGRPDIYVRGPDGPPSGQLVRIPDEPPGGVCRTLPSPCRGRAGPDVHFPDVFPDFSEEPMSNTLFFHVDSHSTPLNPSTCAPRVTRSGPRDSGGGR